MLGDEPDDCVLDSNTPDDCAYAKEISRKEECFIGRILNNGDSKYDIRTRI